MTYLLKIISFLFLKKKRHYHSLIKERLKWVPSIIEEHVQLVPSIQPKIQAATLVGAIRIARLYLNY
jgi:hypothetical protein